MDAILAGCNTTFSSFGIDATDNITGIIYNYHIYMFAQIYIILCQVAFQHFQCVRIQLYNSTTEINVILNIQTITLQLSSGVISELNLHIAQITRTRYDIGALYLPGTNAFQNHFVVVVNTTLVLTGATFRIRKATILSELHKYAWVWSGSRSKLIYKLALTFSIYHHALYVEVTGKESFLRRKTYTVTFLRG